MANRRMFSKKIIDTDYFLDLPISTQALYFHLCMRADDDGFIGKPKRIMRMIGLSDDDMKLLIAKQFIIPFESGVCIIKHWRVHNYIQKDRYTKTFHKYEKSLLGVNEEGAYEIGIDKIEEKETKKLSEARQKRLDVKKESDLPYSFDYKIRDAFAGKKCPICGCTMEKGEFSENRMPTIQHNIPISKGGEHKIENISVVCRSCNSRKQDTETPPYNVEEVAKVWESIGNGAGMDTQGRLGLGKVSDSKESQNKFSDESLEVQLSKYLYQKILDNDPKAKKPKFEKWAEHMDKLMRIDGRTEAEIRQVIDFCQSDEFWRANVLSANKLRDKFSALLIKSKTGKGAGKKRIGGMEAM